MFEKNVRSHFVYQALKHSTESFNKLIIQMFINITINVIIEYFNFASLLVLLFIFTFFFLPPAAEALSGGRRQVE